jgi:hypothetical protein
MNAQRWSIGLLAAGHLFTDLNQGAMPALLPVLIALLMWTLPAGRPAVAADKLDK